MTVVHGDMPPAIPDQRGIVETRHDKHDEGDVEAQDWAADVMVAIHFDVGNPLSIETTTQPHEEKQIGVTLVVATPHAAAIENTGSSNETRSSVRHRRRTEERRGRREDLLRSNGMLPPLPPPGGVPPALEPAMEEAFRNQGDLEAQTWANAAIAALQIPPVEPHALEPTAELEKFVGANAEAKHQQTPSEGAVAEDEVKAGAHAVGQPTTSSNARAQD
ncbi:hypothetical protein DL93DRAFT_2229209 [Clavulina sp. PMI_390]|nr:hypothetical protein DL93DRAFT_2229209 [Clavulina sp. PMI_390]